MKKQYSFDLSSLSVTATEAFSEASAEELRVLLVLVERGGRIDSESLARLSGVSLARAGAAVVFWEGAGVLTESSAPRVTEEFSTRAERTDIYSQPRERTAEVIRSKGLRDLMDECATMLGKTSLSDVEVHKITSLASDFALSEEFIAALASHLSSNNKFSVTRLYNDARELVEKKIDTPERLDAYIKESESEAGYMRELRRTLGIKGRTLVPSEKELFKRWCVDFGYSAAIIGEAYDITVMHTGERELHYMDTILTRWHENGCKTVAECRALSESGKPTAEQTRVGGSATKKKKEKTPEFLSFDPNEALKRALERSYSNIPDDE